MKDLGWEGFVRDRQIWGDFTGIGGVYHPVCRLLGSTNTGGGCSFVGGEVDGRAAESGPGYGPPPIEAGACSLFAVGVCLDGLEGTVCGYAVLGG